MSDLLIRGFNLPKYGSMTITINPNGIVKRLHEKTYHPPEIFHATQLPPHGGLIDVDELLTHVIPKNPDAEFHCVDVQDIENAPTIIPADRIEEKFKKV